jgi:hypothetical protein
MVDRGGNGEEMKMGRKGKRKSPIVEFEPEDLEELEEIAKLVEEAIKPRETLHDGGIPISDLERLLEREGLKGETWFEVYWSG